MADDPLIRAVGADHRNTVAAYYHNRGQEFGYKLARRFVEETVAEVAEAHSRRDAYNLIMRVGDRLLIEPEVTGVALLDGEEPMPAVRAAIEAVATAAAPERFYDLGEGASVTLHEGQTLEGLYQQTRHVMRELNKLRRQEWPSWRRTLRAVLDLLPPAWFVAFMVGLCLGGQR